MATFEATLGKFWLLFTSISGRTDCKYRKKDEDRCRERKRDSKFKKKTTTGIELGSSVTIINKKLTQTAIN